MYYSIFRRNGGWQDFYKVAPVTSIIILANLAFFIVATFMNSFNFFSFSTQVLFDLGGIVPVTVLEGNEWWRIISAGFLHSGILHFGLNMIIGMTFLSYGLERIIGSKKFSIIYFVSLIGSGLAVVYLSDYTTITIGASGAIYGVLGALLYVTIYRKDLVTERDAQTIRTLAFINIAFTVIPIFGNISISGHAGGLIAGFLVSYLVIRRNVFKVLR